jgi:hypothetical protein
MSVTRLAGLCAALLLAATAAFVGGVALERGESHSEAVETDAHGAETTADGDENSEIAEGAENETVREVDLESPTLVGAGVAVSLLVALVVWRRPTIAALVAATAFCVLFAVLDGREVLHQIDEGSTSIIAVALVAMALHAGAAAAAAGALRPLRPRRAS